MIFFYKTGMKILDLSRMMIFSDTVDGSEIPFPTTVWMVLGTL